jgi:hypothetical protein
MGIVAFLGGCIAALVGIVLALKFSLWILGCVALPLFWLWMLIDAIARRDETYPSASPNEKILWIVVMIVIPISVIAYWFVVYVPARRRARMALGGQGWAGSGTGAPVPPSV